MHALVEKLMTALPIFGRQMSALLVGPKTAVLTQDLESEPALGQALTFVAVSFGIAYIAQIPFLPDTGNKELLFGMLAIQSALSFALNVVLVVLAWRIVGGKLAWRKVVVATCYFCGVTTLLFLGIFLIAAGTFKSIDPSIYQQVISYNVADPSDLKNNSGYRAFSAIVVLAFVATYAWIFCVWGAYRELLQLSRLRSALALAIFLVLSPLLFVAQQKMAATVIPSRRGPAVPSELVGQWESVHPHEANGIHWDDVAAYSFLDPTNTPNGAYTSLKIIGSVQTVCLNLSFQQESGRIVVQGSDLKLIAEQGSHFTRNSCTGQSPATPMDLRRTDYKFKVDQQPTGWTLCLSDRYGQTCLSPHKPQP